MVMNTPEMEAKVHEATNDDPWYSHRFICAFGYLIVRQGVRVRR